MRISKTLLVAAAMLATASLAQAQQNVTTATWVGPALGASGTWDKWTGTPSHNYWRATIGGGLVLVNGARLTNTATLTFDYAGPVLAGDPNGIYPTQTIDILYDSSNVSSQSQTLRFLSSGYRILPGAFNKTVSAEPTAANFTDIDLAKSPALSPYLTSPNGTLQLGAVTFTSATPALSTDPKPFVVLRNTTTADRITVTNAGTAVILENLVASTISGAFRGDGDITKTGGGVLQYQGHYGQMFGYTNNNVALPYSYIQTPFGYALASPGTNTIYGRRPIDLSPNVATPDATNANNWRLSGLQGRVQVDAGLLMVSGYLNMWHDYGARVESQILAAVEIPTVVAKISPNAGDALGVTYALAKRMTGASSIVLNGSAELSFTNTAAQVGSLRLNFAHNLQAGDNHDQFQTTVTTGPDENYRLGIHIDQDRIGSVGILAGGGKVIKTGAGTLRVLNDSRMTGDFIAAGGTTILESATGLTFANNSSFNIAGTQDTADFNGSQATEAALGLSRRGADIRYAQVASNSNNYLRWDYRPALFPDTGTLTVQTDAAGQYTSYSSTGAEVILRNNQTVRNFQADFALRSKGTTNVGNATTGEVYTAVDAVRTAADVNNKGELVIVGTGIGGTLRLDGHTLTINQDAGRDGYYNGNIFGYDTVNGVSGGRIIKTGAGTLVLLLSGGSSYDYTEIQGGTFIANVQGLGQKQVYIGDGGTFAILQNNAGTLSANLAGSAGSTLKLLASAVINNGSGAGIQVNPGLDPGEVNVINGQDAFFGNIVVNDGVDLSFTGGRNNTFINASSVTLDSGSARETKLSFGDTNQLVRNLSGNDSAKVELGRGDITLEQNASLTYLGSITGVGSLVKQGSAAFTLAGTTGTNLFKDAYYGATIVRPGGGLAAGTANATPNTSALVLVGAGAYANGNQAQVVGALFGSVGSVLNLGTGSLTVGYTAARASSLTTALQGSNPLLADYLGTTTQFNPVTDATVAPVLATGAAGELGSTSVALSSISNVAVGQTIGATSLAAGTYVTRVIAGGSAPINGIVAAGLAVLPSTNTAGLAVGQIVTGTGIAADTVITALSANSITLSKPLVANATGLVTGSAGVIVSAPLTAAAAGVTFSVLRTRTIDVTALSLTAAELNQLYTGALSMPDLTSLYLTRVAVGADIGSYQVLRDTTLADRAFAATRSFDGKLVGSGALIKIGAEDLNLGGSSPGFTGPVQIDGGSLNLIWAAGSALSPLPNIPYFQTTAPGVLAVTVNDAYDPLTDATKRTFVTPILGSGSFVKRGAGYLVLAPGVVAGQTPYTGTTTVAEGWLEMAALATNGAAVISAGSHLVLTTAVDVSYPGAVSGAGQLEIRAGTKTLTAGGALTHTGGTLVRSGTLLASAGWAGATTGDITVLAGATARLNVVNPLAATGVFVGAGTIVKEGLGALTLNTPTTAFAGTYRSLAGTTNLGVDNLFGDPLANPVQSVAAVDLQGSSILNILGGTEQSFRNLSGTADATIVFAAPGSEVNLQVDPTGNFSFAGRFQQAAGVTDGTIVKTGAGVLTLAPTAGPNSLGNVVVLEGQLVGTVAGYASADLYVGTTGNIAFHNAVAGEANLVTFTNTVLGAELFQTGLGVGTVGKTGAGIVVLTAAADDLDFNIEAGELRLTDSRPGLQDLFTATIAAGSTFRLALAGDRDIGVLGDPLSSQITGGGTLDLRSDTVGGARTVFAYAQPGVAITNLGADVTLDVSTLTDITGITGATGSILEIGSVGGGRALTLTQSVDGAFGGVVQGTDNLVFKGPGMFRYTGATSLSSPATVTVLGGGLGVDVANTKAIDLIKDTTLTPGRRARLGVMVDTGVTAAYAGALTGNVGAAELVKLGAGTLDLTDAAILAGSTLANQVFGAYVVKEGTLAVTLDANGHILPDASNLSRPLRLEGGTLAVEVSATGGTLQSESVAGSSGSLNVTTNPATLPANLATLTVLGDIGGDVSVAGGTRLALGASGAPLLSIAGDVAVTTGSILSGSANIGGDLTVGVGATVAPGYSPGSQVVAGDFTLAGAANLEVTGTPVTVAFTAAGGASGQKVITTANTAGLVVGQSVAGAGIPAGSVITAISANTSITISANLTAAAVGSITASQYNDIVNFAGVADLNAGGTGSLVIKRWNAPTTSTAPAFGRRFVLFRDTAVDATPTVAESFATLLPANAIGTTDTNGRYLIVEPRATGAFPGLPTSPSEYAAYFVGGADRYAIPGVADGIVTYLQGLTKTGAGGALAAGGTTFVPSNVATDANYLSELGARLMIMDDAALAPAIRSLQPGSLAAIPATVALEQRAETDALQRRLDQRRYDRAGYSVYYNEFFVEATSTSFKGGSGADAPPFDSTLTGLLGGYIKDLNPWSVAGFTLGASRTKSTLAEGAGSVSGNAYRATAFFSGMLGERRDTYYLDAGLSLGKSSNTSDRVTFMGTQHGSPSATTYGAFARFGAGLATKGGVNFTPFVGLDMVRVSGGSFTESNTTGDPTKLSVNSYAYTSARASTGTGMAWLSVHEGQMIKFAFDVEAFAELGGGKSAEIDANFGGVGDFTTKTNVAAGAGFRIVPSFTFGPNPDTAYYLTLSLEKAGSTKTTGLEAGYRRRF